MAIDAQLKNEFSKKLPWPWLVTGVVLLLAVIQLRFQGRIWWCACGQPDLWWTDTESSHNSQHLFDPYALTHVLHGLTFYGALAWTAKFLSQSWRFCLAIAIELLWEVIENTDFVIQRYRTATMALGYEGDSIANCFGDTLACAIGIAIAQRVGLKGCIAIFAITELILLIWIRDSLLLNVVMLLHPLDTIKAWQLGK